ncbi:MAG: precorrin-2 C(20)-methyltransferase [Deltaproteobacteria bacterium]|jgi:precorrin-2/cobalt-factor-2 C20-methyltransferase|nr:precorrin-2 C(20)-methyltransferase [Deltaproteobacteria bacterium]
MTVIEQWNYFPDFNLFDQSGQMVNLETIDGRWSVFFFFKRNSTDEGLQIARKFSDEAENFAAIGVDLYGVSEDSSASQLRFVERNDLKLRLLGDPNLDLMEAVGAWRKKKCPSWKRERFNRLTAVVDPEGMTRAVIDAPDGLEHPAAALAAVKDLLKSSAAKPAARPIKPRPTTFEEAFLSVRPGQDRSQPGVLYGLGVGPGDPSLITVKAVEILEKVEAIFTASTSENEESLAARIAAPYLRSGVPIKKLIFPMTKDQDRLDEAWQANAETVAAVLDRGFSAAFLTLGDCLTYSTYAYLLQYLKAIRPEAKVESVPGVTSYQLAAARLNRPLVQGQESLTILGGPTDDDFTRLCEASDNLVILKPYRSTSDVLELLKSMKLSSNAALCSNLGLEGEQIIDDLDREFKEPDGYFSLLLVNKRLDRK